MNSVSSYFVNDFVSLFLPLTCWTLSVDDTFETVEERMRSLGCWAHDGVQMGSCQLMMALAACPEEEEGREGGRTRAWRVSQPTSAQAHFLGDCSSGERMFFLLNFWTDWRLRDDVNTVFFFSSSRFWMIPKDFVRPRFNKKKKSPSCRQTTFVETSWSL